VLLALWFIPIYLGWYYYYYRKRRLIVKSSYDPTRFQAASPWVSLRYLPLFLQLIGLFWLIIALARPQSSENIIERSAEGIDIMLVLDVSGSMETEDFPPNRLAVAKENAIKFIDDRKGDRIGLTLFAEDAFSYAPLTLDYIWLKKLINDINFHTLPKQGTAMGTAMAIALNRLLESKSASKVMVVFTDGANNRGEMDPLTAARLGGTHKIRIYTVGIGKPSFVRQTVNGPETVRSDLDEETLEKVATYTEGKYFRADRPEKLSEILAEISSLEKNKMNEDVFRDIRDVYPFFIKLAIVFFLLAFLFMLSPFYNPLEM
jgi:Ca-activated chloride channel family protein